MHRGRLRRGVPADGHHHRGQRAAVVGVGVAHPHGPRQDVGTQPHEGVVEDRGDEASGELDQRRLRRARDEIEAIAVTALRAQWRGVHENAALDELAAKVVAGESDPYASADLLLESLEDGAPKA